MGGKTEKSTVTLPGFGDKQWAGLNSAVAHLAKNGYDAEIREVLRQGGLDPEALEATARAAIAQQTAEQTAKLTVQMYHCNHLGTPIALINKQGMIDWAIELDPWGNVLNEFNPKGIDQPIRMQGQQIDRESGLFYNRHRYYDPNMGRYITQDPIGLEGGQHLYLYSQNPTEYVDPLGLTGNSGQRTKSLGKNVSTDTSKPLSTQTITKEQGKKDSFVENLIGEIKDLINPGLEPANRTYEAFMCTLEKNKKTGEITDHNKGYLAGEPSIIDSTKPFPPSPDKMRPGQECIKSEPRRNFNAGPLPGLGPPGK
jgi:RHS repeat-associated protein